MTKTSKTKKVILTISTLTGMAFGAREGGTSGALLGAGAGYFIPILLESVFNKAADKAAHHYSPFHSNNDDKNPYDAQ